MSMTATVAQFDMTLDLLVYSVFGRQDDRLVERTLALNPGLAAHGVILPVGTVVTLPDREAPRPAKRDSIKLWD